MKRLFCTVLAVLVLSVSVLAYDDTPPTSSPLGYTCFITMQTRELGQITVYLPVTWQENTFSWDGTNLRNITTSTVTGYWTSNTDNYVRWSSFSLPQYREPSGSSWSLEDLTVQEIISTNVSIAESYEEVGVSRSDNYYVILILIGGVLLLILFMKKF